MPALRLQFSFDDGSVVAIENIGHPKLSGQPYRVLMDRFFEMVSAQPAPRVLELGARARSGNVHTNALPKATTYVGFDVLDGPNVDVVGDAHTLSQHVEASSFDAVLSIATSEHLLMPWKVAIEVNKVLRPGGLFMSMTHQTWPVHEEPWDFWRFSEYTWPALFNAYTGFEVLGSTMGERVEMVAEVCDPVTVGFGRNWGYLATALLCRKVTEPRVSWDVPAAEVIASAYPR